MKKLLTILGLVTVFALGVGGTATKLASAEAGQSLPLSETAVEEKWDAVETFDSIREAEMSADYVIVSVHNHQIEGMDKSAVPRFLEKLFHEIVDFGADAVIGHGPHLLRAIEVYKEKPIFYSLGDFLIQLYDVAFAPEEFYEKQGMTSDDSVMDLLKKRSRDFTCGLMAQKEMREAVIPLWETEGKSVKSIRLMPVLASLGEGKHLEGLPRPAQDTAFMDRLAALCAPYGVSLSRGEDGIYTCNW